MRAAQTPQQKSGETKERNEPPSGPLPPTNSCPMRCCVPTGNSDPDNWTCRSTPAYAGSVTTVVVWLWVGGCWVGSWFLSVGSLVRCEMWHFRYGTRRRIRVLEFVGPLVRFGYEISSVPLGAQPSQKPSFLGYRRFTET